MKHLILILALCSLPLDTFIVYNIVCQIDDDQDNDDDESDDDEEEEGDESG